MNFKGFFSAEQADANNERVVFRLATFPQATSADVCTVTDYTALRYSILMRNGKFFPLLPHFDH